MIGLVGYVVMPTAPPWMFPYYGFVDGVNHQTGFGALANPYAAMPSLHAADALIVGIFLFRACRSWWSKALWALWPAWVWFCVLATANHFWLDVARGNRGRAHLARDRLPGREAPGAACGGCAHRKPAIVSP